jgi:peptidoglycan/LPS O-acetylase OafA/YrhL
MRKSGMVPLTPIGSAQTGVARLTINSKDHIPSLDGLRGIAILLVFFRHYVPQDRQDPLSVASRFGWIGVDLFLVLSGFLITGILIDTRESVNRFKSFYVRRVLRIFPLYFLAIAIVIIGTHFLQGFRSWINIPIFLYGSNIVLAFPNGDLVFPPYFNCGHFWSLALEEQFYTIWPFVVYMTPDRRTLMRVCALGIAAAVIFRAGAAHIGMSPVSAYSQLPTRMDGLLAGALLSLLVREANGQRYLNENRLRWILWTACAAFVPVLVATSRIRLSAPANLNAMRTTEKIAADVGFSILAIILAASLALSLIPGTTWNRVCSLRVLRFFGKYSYGLYVWHFLFIPITIGWVEQFRLIVQPRYLADLFYCTCMLGLFTAISILSYSQFEVRFLRLKSKFAPFP